jgi:hypothetical protein
MDSTRDKPTKVDAIAKNIALEADLPEATLPLDADALAQAQAAVDRWEQRHGSFRAKVRPRYAGRRSFKR